MAGRAGRTSTHENWPRCLMKTVRRRSANGQQDAKEHWTVENGELVNDGHGAYLVTNDEFGDYEFLIDYKTVPRADSGIYLKGTPQVQIWDYTDPGKFGIDSDLGSGGLWNNSAGAPGKESFRAGRQTVRRMEHF